MGTDERDMPTTARTTNYRIQRPQTMFINVYCVFEIGEINRTRDCVLSEGNRDSCFATIKKRGKRETRPVVF